MGEGGRGPFCAGAAVFWGGVEGFALGPLSSHCEAVDRGRWLFECRRMADGWVKPCWLLESVRLVGGVETVREAPMDGLNFQFLMYCSSVQFPFSSPVWASMLAS